MLQGGDTIRLRQVAQRIAQRIRLPASQRRLNDERAQAEVRHWFRLYLYTWVRVGRFPVMQQFGKTTQKLHALVCAVSVSCVRKSHISALSSLVCIVHARVCVSPGSSAA